MNSVIYADIISALQLAKVIGCIQTRYGEVRISEREALEKYRFKKKTLEAFKDIRDGAVKRTGGKPNSRKLYPLYALIEIELTDKIMQKIIDFETLIRKQERAYAKASQK